MVPWQSVFSTIHAVGDQAKNVATRLGSIAAFMVYCSVGVLPRKVANQLVAGFSVTLYAFCVLDLAFELCANCALRMGARRAELEFLFPTTLMKHPIESAG